MTKIIAAFAAALLCAALVAANDHDVCCEALTTECEACKCKAHGEDCGKCLADPKCAMMTIGGCSHPDLFASETAIWIPKNLTEMSVKATCADRAQAAKDAAICNAKDLQSPWSCAKCMATNTSTVKIPGFGFHSGKCVALKNGGCATDGGMTPQAVLDTCPKLPTPGAKCVKGTPDYAQIDVIEHCGKNISYPSMSCECAEEGTWMCAVADFLPAPCKPVVSPTAGDKCVKGTPDYAQIDVIEHCGKNISYPSKSCECAEEGTWMCAVAYFLPPPCKPVVSPTAGDKCVKGTPDYTNVVEHCGEPFTASECTCAEEGEWVCIAAMPGPCVKDSNNTQPQVKATQPGTTTLAATTADSGGSNVEVLKLAKQLAEEAYKTEGCAKTPDTDKCKGLQAAVNKATSALEDAEDSAATAFASASALVAVAVGVAAGVVF